VALCTITLNSLSLLSLSLPLSSLPLPLSLSLSPSLSLSSTLLSYALDSTPSAEEKSPSSAAPPSPAAALPPALSDPDVVRALVALATQQQQQQQQAPDPKPEAVAVAVRHTAPPQLAGDRPDAPTRVPPNKKAPTLPPRTSSLSGAAQTNQATPTLPAPPHTHTQPQQETLQTTAGAQVCVFGTGCCEGCRAKKSVSLFLCVCLTSHVNQTLINRHPCWLGRSLTTHHRARMTMMSFRPTPVRAHRICTL
jgi:hypothetical protein